MLLFFLCSLVLPVVFLLRLSENLLPQRPTSECRLRYKQEAHVWSRLKGAGAREDVRVRGQMTQPINLFPHRTPLSPSAPQNKTCQCPGGQSPGSILGSTWHKGDGKSDWQLHSPYQHLKRIPIICWEFLNSVLRLCWSRWTPQLV